MNTTFGPFDVRAGVVERASDYFDLMVHHRPGTQELRIRGAVSLNDAYGNLNASGVGGAGTVALMDVPVGQVGQTAYLNQTGRARVEESTRGHTRFKFAFRDLVYSPDAYLFVRVQENRIASGGWLICAGPVNLNWPIQGPITVIPPASWFGTGPIRHISLQGLAPGGTGFTAGVNPVLDMSVQLPLPMHIWLPAPITTGFINNLEPAAGGDDLLYASSLGAPMTMIPAGGQIQMEGIGRQIVLAAVGAGAAAFRIDVASDMFG